MNCNAVHEIKLLLELCTSQVITWTPIISLCRSFQYWILCLYCRIIYAKHMTIPGLVFLWICLFTASPFLPRWAYSQHRSNARTVPTARNCPEVYKWTICCSECGKIFLFIIQVNPTAATKRREETTDHQRLKTLFMYYPPHFFSYDFLPPFIVCATILLHNSKYPCHSSHNDFSYHQRHLLLIKPFTGRRHGPLCSLYFRE